VNSVAWLTILWLVPAVGAVLVLLLTPAQRALAKWVGLGFAVAVPAVAAVLAVRFDSGGPQYQFVESHQWIPAFGAGYTLGLDGIALVLVLLTAVLMPLLMLAGWNDAADGNRATQIYVALMLAVEAMVLVSLVALDVLLFYVFFEAMLVTDAHGH
jgi:NADH-quinone oxidoreductase subunit M